MKELQTPQKEVSRSSKPKDCSFSASSSQSIKPQKKIAKKSLNGAFTSVSEDSSSQISPEDAYTLVSPLNSELISTPTTSNAANDVVSNDDLETTSQCEASGSPPTSTITNGVISVGAMEQAGHRKVVEDKVKVAVEEEYYHSAHPQVDHHRFLNLTTRIVLFCISIWWLAVSTLLLSHLGLFDDPSSANPPPT